MKFLAGLAALIMILLSCGKKDVQMTETELPETVTYDTTAIDSFSPGAISVDVARQIRMSSLAYQDSVRKVREQMEIEKALKEKEAKEKAEKEKLKKEEAKNKETTAVGNTANP